MIFSHLPGPPQIIDFPLGGKGYKYLVVDTQNKRVVVMENATEDKRQGFRELAEMNETNLYMLPPFFQEYTRKCWERWGLYDHEN